MTPYSILTVTPLLKESISCVLRAERVDPSLHDELCQWVDGESRTIAFDLVIRIHKESESLGRPSGTELVHGRPVSDQSFFVKLSNRSLIM